MDRAPKISHAYIDPSILPIQDKCQMNAVSLAKAICQAEGKNPDKIYKKKPLYEYSIEFANDILKYIPKPATPIKPKTTPASYDEKLKRGVQAYIDSFNETADEQYVPVAEMRPHQLQVHMSALRSAINEMLKDE